MGFPLRKAYIFQALTVPKDRGRRAGSNGSLLMEAKVKMSLEFNISESGLEDAMAEFDELTIEELIREVLDRSIACDEIATKVIEGPNTLEEYDQQAEGA